MSTQDWTAVEILMPPELDSDDEALDILSALLFELGAQGFETLDDQRPIRIVAAFPADLASAALAETIREALDEAEIPCFGVTTRPYAAIDWATHWKSHFTPLDFDKIWVVPSWLEAPPEAGTVLWIDPSMAFGTGLHSTTSLCLETIVELSPIDSLLDVGTGTGILAFAALKLGARRVVGLDNDPDAITVAEENAQYNGLADRVVLSGKGPAELGEKFGVVVANILPQPLVDMAQELDRALAPDGLLILSGLLQTQVDQVCRAYERLGFARERVLQREEWAAVLLRRAR